MFTNTEEIQQCYRKIEEALKGTRRLVVLTHDNPDPDSVSSAVTLSYIVKNRFKVPSVVRYGGIVGRAENRAMIRVLGLRVALLTDKDFKPGVNFAMVDTQPKTGNSSFPKNRKPLIVIDHHPLRKTTRVDFADVRTNYGATATILTEYLMESGLEVPSTLATALSYGISSETQDLGREAGEKDIQAYLALFPLSNKKILAQIEHPRLPRDYFVTLNRALHHSFVYKNAVATTLGEVQNPDFVPFIADFMLRCERISWSLCVGRFKERIVVSIRTTNTKGEAGNFLRRLIGKKGTAGGHGMIAGGQIPCPTMEHEHCTKVEEELIQGFLRKLGYKEAGEMTPLLTTEPIHT
ncbi:MAG: bifunctional oligoribonuclease/PAP phosphatase NrnA [Candidatus Omnitrophica bacterium]|nr:bifunctional oligoribonuclease/PAP phosphatase NrnA [Candidatus Omnitrophota bacterium]